MFDKEERIVLLRDPRRYSYWRESIWVSPEHRGAIDPSHIPDLAAVAGYAECMPRRAPNTLYHRRFWWLSTDDLNMTNDDAPPDNVIDPRSIRVNHRTLTIREVREEIERIRRSLC